MSFQSIYQSVGRDGVNEPGDQRTVARLLLAVPTWSGGHGAVIYISPIPGLIPAELIGAIETFQRRQFQGRADGRVDVGGNTLRRLNELAVPALPVGPQPKTIGAAVGRPPAHNEPGDTDTVSDLLMRVATTDGGPQQPIHSAPFPGMASPSLVAAIEAFQRRQFGRSDARVDVGGATLGRLNTLTRNGTAPKRTIQPVVSLLGGAVGRAPAPNHFDDQVRVLTWLSRVPASQGGPGRVLPPPLMPGQVSAALVPAIETFQRRQFGSFDGRVDPGKQTEKRLHALALVVA